MGRAHYNLVRQSLEKTDLYWGQSPLLFVLSKQDGMIHFQLAAEMEVSPAAITNMVKRMEKAGFVRPNGEILEGNPTTGKTCLSASPSLCQEGPAG
jgi:hypothetical protein